MSKNQPPLKRPNKEMRPQEHLGKEDVEQLIATAKKFGKSNGERDALMIELMYRHGLRVSELVGLVWKDFNFKSHTFYPHRAKNGINTPHPIPLKLEKRLRAYQKRCKSDEYLFPSRKTGLPISERTVRHIVQTVGREAGLGSHVHPHMLRHSCGFHLVKKGWDIRRIQAYLGHSSINSTVIYTAVTVEELRGAWD